LDDEVSLTGLIAGQHDPVLLWHWRLGHPSLQNLGQLFLLSILSLH